MMTTSPSAMHALGKKMGNLKKIQNWTQNSRQPLMNFWKSMVTIILRPEGTLS